MINLQNKINKALKAKIRQEEKFLKRYKKTPFPTATGILYREEKIDLLKTCKHSWRSGDDDLNKYIYCPLCNCGLLV